MHSADQIKMSNILLLYDGRRLYQFNEGDFFVQVLFLNELFSN